jgi:hypothetical protein
MSYNVRQVDGTFFMAEADKAKALAALKEGYVGTYYKFAKCRYLEDALEAADFDVTTDDMLNVTGIQYERESYGDLEKVFPLLRPFVRPGSFLEFVGEDGDRWRIKFTETAAVRQQAKIVWE